jgi:hypothetical protein
MNVHTCDHPACSFQLTAEGRFWGLGCQEASKDVAKNKYLPLQARSVRPARLRSTGRSVLEMFYTKRASPSPGLNTLDV